MKNNKVLVFDMDGTIANLYAVEGWLESLRAEDTRPYEEAEPMFDKNFLWNLNALRYLGYKVVITTWTAKGGSKAYNKATAKAKREWLEKHNFPVDEFHAVKYGTTKANATRKKGNGQTLFDDNDTIRKGWKLGETVHPDRMADYIRALLTREIDRRELGLA